MSQHKSEARVTEDFSENEIASYLRSHPDFFERHAVLLLGLKLPHRTAGTAVSLVERQVSMLRQRNAQLERQLKDLIAVAKLNDQLVEKSHRLGAKLIALRDAGARLDTIETSLREDFAAERAVLVLFSERGLAAPAHGFVKAISRDDPSLKPFAAFLRAARPRCGLMRERQREVLFDRDAATIQSAAMVPVGAQGDYGFLVIGSRDPHHFHPGQRLDFLTRLGELITAALGGAPASDAAR
jgi:uncharacterized protein